MALEYLILIVAAFLPPFIYAVWIRNLEKIKRQTWSSILVAFIWGASISVVASLVLHILIGIPLDISFYDHPLSYLLSAVVVAPIAEEFSKPLAFWSKTIRSNIKELEDGLIYGAVAGLGFSATENLFYGSTFLTYGLFWFILLMGARVIGASLLHASATAITVYGIGKSFLKKTRILRVLPYMLLAMILHGTYNFLLTFENIGVLVGLLFSLIIVLIAITRVRKKIIYLDQYVSR